MAGTKANLSKLELQIMETLWARPEASIREMQEAFPEANRPGYTTVQTMVYRLEAKGVVRRVRKVGNFHMFAATVSRDAAQRRLVDELLAMFGGQSRPVVAHLIEAGKLTLEDVEFAEKALRESKSTGQQVSDPAKAASSASLRNGNE
jgi:BlaI family transcriptional regulator, penicillinase repressor